MQLGPSDTLPSLSLEIFKLWLDEALGSWSNAKSEPALEGKWAWELLKSKQPKLYYDFTCDSCSTAEVPRCDLVCLLVLLAISVS